MCTALFSFSHAIVKIHPNVDLCYFCIYSSIDQSNFMKIFEVANDFSSLNKLSNVYHDLSKLVNFRLCKHIKYFGRVDVFIAGIESVDNFNLFLKYCKYSNYVGLMYCKLVDSLEFEGLDEEVLDGRMEVLWLWN